MVTGQKKFAMDLDIPVAAADDDLPAAELQRHRAVGREPRAGQGDARRHRRRRDLSTGRGRACPYLRPVHRRHPRPARRLGRRHDRQGEQRQPAGEGRLRPAPDGPRVLRPTRSSRSPTPSTTAVALRWRPTARSRTSGKTAAEIWGSEQDARSSRCSAIALLLDLPEDKVKVHCPSGWWLLRPAPVLGRLLRGRRGLEAVRQAGAPDVPPDRRRPSRPHAPDDGQQGARDQAGQQRHQLHRCRAPARRATGPTVSARSSPVRRLPRTRVLASPATRRWATSRSPWASTSWSRRCRTTSARPRVYLNEIFAYDTLPTCAVRNVYSPDTGTARELHVVEDG